MSTILWIIGATIIVSLLSLIGILTIAVNHKQLQKILLWLVGFSAGALMGGAFLHLIPEAIEKTSLRAVGLLTLIGFSAFFVIERVLHWHHCHKYGDKCPVHMFTYMNLIGDGIHNFIDGLIIAASFIISIPLGIATTIAVITHELPQEIGDFGVLVYGGFSKIKALFYNFLTAITAVLGAIIGFLISSSVEGFIVGLLPFAAGGFIYIAASDLVPELHKEVNIKKAIISFLFFLIGISFMYGIKILFKG
jgi:zinc and cadmium transporter